MRLALFAPDIPQNAGTLMRLCACWGLALDIIEPAGFALSDRAFRRAGMDYVEKGTLARHSDWAAFRARVPGRPVLVETDGLCPYTDFHFARDDILVLGSETEGLPPWLREAVPDQVMIPMRPGLRSINVALAGAIVLSEALRQTQAFPPPPDSAHKREAGK
ncbi:MAG: tRNA (cytidine(34)-2'-O)-methyltransferase [Alphaproteobacteria bacterium]|nr:tRNA (cytidine(34)-2'-O)-methyltransferase [Alphaproteobacteria bacterium]